MKKITVWLVALSLLLASIFALSGCNLKSSDKTGNPVYAVDVENFSGIAVFGESVNLDGINLIKTKGEERTVIPIELSMLTSAVDTSKTGDTEIKFSYDGISFTVPVTVKYRVQIKSDGEIINTVYVTSAEELSNLTAPEKDGYVFNGWTPDISGGITGNITLEAAYTENVPALTEIRATYGDKLSEIALPESTAGKWVFKDADGTVGNAGKRTFPVEFVLNNGTVIKTDTVSVNVAKRRVTFSNVTTDFIYNGLKQIPTYQTDVFVDVIFYEDADANYTDAGIYTYCFEVDDPNYFGELEGSYEIAKAAVTVKIESYTIFSNDALPKVNYQISGFEDVSLLGLTVTDPEDIVTGAGEYTLTATVSNPSINLTVEEGTLTVKSTQLDVETPDFSATPVTYGDTLSSLVFPFHPNGKWTWQSPTDLVGDAGKATHVAIFTPTDTRYDILTVDIEITILPKALTIEIVGGTDFVYNGAERTLEYVIKDSDGNTYDLEVLGNTPFKNAGTYSLMLYLDNKNYEAQIQATVTVEKATPKTNFSDALKTTYSPTLKVSDLSYMLDSGYSFTNPDDKIASAGTHYIAAVYTPADTRNYNQVFGEFRVDVAKAAASIENVNISYEFVYSGSEFKLNGITASYDGAVINFTYYLLGGSTVTAIKDAGVYTVIISLDESTNYLGATATSTVTVNSAENTDSVTEKQNAIYGDKLSSLSLPTSDNGSWSFKGQAADTTVGNAGENKFTAVFTPNNANYKSREVIITVTVAKRSVNAPSISEENRKQAYTGSTLNSGLTNGDGYVVTDNGGTDKGTYTVTLSLINSNYVWSDGESGNKTLTYTIVEAANGWVVAPTIKDKWTFGDTDSLTEGSSEYLQYKGYASALFGTVTVTYAAAGSDSFTETLPTNAGKYVARFTATHPNATTKIEDVEFEILKKSVVIPTYTKDYIYTGEGINAGITSTDLYSVTDEKHYDAGSFVAKITLLYPENYVWSDGDTAASKNLPYVISRATASITDFSINSIKFGEALTPTASVGLGASYSFYYATEKNGTYSATVPTAVGTYYVKVVVHENENICSSESAPTMFVIERADVTISGYSESYSKTYNGEALAILGVKASNGAEVKIAIMKNGEACANIVNAGTYTVTLYTEETESYNAASVTVTATVNAADNTDTVKTAQNSVYGNKLNTLELPASVSGSWSFKGASADTTVGNAGENKFTAVFTPNSENYNSREVVITVSVEKATVNVPIISDIVYDGELHNSGVTESRLYTVTDEGGRDKGTYFAIFTLKDSSNYKWETTSAASVTVEYHISAAINSWKTEPGVRTPVEYGDTESLASAEANFGGVRIEYKKQNEGDESYTETAPTLPGIYIVRFTTTDENYSKLTVTKVLEITKKKIDAPTVNVNSFEYTGEKITLGLSANNYYDLSDEGSIVVKSGISAIITLKSEYYEWSDGTAGLTKTYTYSIVPATNTVTSPVIEGWTYGDEANLPTASDDFGSQIYFVYSSTIDGEYSEDVPENAGTYYVKAIAKATENVNRAESSPVSFTISKKAASITGALESYEANYNKNGYTVSGISSTNGTDLEYSYVYGGGSVSAIKNAGTYTVTVTLPETDNYLGDEVTFTVTIKKIVNNDTIPTYSATYGDLLASLTLPETSTGSWAWKNASENTTVGNAGAATHTLVFTPDDSVNFEAREASVTVSVAKAIVNTPAAKNPTSEYNNTKHTSGLTDTALYTVTDNGGTNVGNYTATLTLTDSANYVWDSLDNASVTTAVTYTITPGENEITEAAIGSWTYGEAGSSGSATAKYGSIKIEYKKADEGDDKYTETLPNCAGSYVARFSTTDANCPVVSTTRSFTINKASVTVPTVNNLYYNASKQTSGLTDTEFYTVTDNGGTNVGDYSATLTLKDKVNYKWNTTGESSDVTLSYKIQKTTVTLSGLSAGWSYDNPKTPTVTASHTFVESLISFLYSLDGGSTWSATPPTAVGAYKVKATVASNENYTVIDAISDFSIDRATPTFSAPSFAGGTHYQNQLDLSTAELQAYNENNTNKPISGTFTFGDVVFADGTNMSYVALTFTPDDTTNYKPVTVTYNMTLVSVAYLNNVTPYGTVEDAVLAANRAGGGTVWVRPHNTALGPITITGYIKTDTNGDPVLDSNGDPVYVLDINSGVTLLLPYGTTNDANGRNSGILATSTATTLAGDTKCVTKVILSSGVTVNNYGIIEICGILSGGSGGKDYAGQTAGNHAKLIMGANSSLISYSGSKIVAFGYIAEETVGNGSSVLLKSGATLTQPFVLRDYKGGSYMYGTYKELSEKMFSPFSLFQFINVTTTIRIDFGGSMHAIGNLYSGKQHNATDINIIGRGGALLELTTEYSYLISKVDPTTQICQLDLYGGAKTNSMALNIDSGLGVFSLDTKKTAFPISYYFNITLNHNPESDRSSSKYTMTNFYKLMPGASITVGENTTLEVDKLIVLDETYVDECKVSKNPYPTGLGGGILNVYGTLIVKNFNGNINILSSNATVAVLSLATITINEAVTVDGQSIMAEITKWNTFTAETFLVYGDEIITPTAGTYVIKDEAIYKLPFSLITMSDGVDRIVVSGKIYDSNFVEIADSYDSDLVNKPLESFYVGEGTTVTFYYQPGYYLYRTGVTPTYNYEGGSVEWISSSTEFASIERIPIINIVVDDNFSVSFSGYILTEDYEVLYVGDYSSLTGNYKDFYVYEGTVVTFSYAAGCYAFVDDEILTSYPSSAGSRTLTVSAGSIIRVIKVPVVNISNSLKNTTVTIAYHGSGTVSVTVKYKIGSGLSSSISSKKLVQLADAANIADADVTALGNQTAEGIGTGSYGLYTYYSTATIVVNQDCTIYVTETTK